GVMLYEITTGRRPFKGDEDADVFRKILTEDPPAPASSNPAIDPGLQAIILKCLEKDPDRRLPTAQALADELARWLRGEPLHIRPESGIERLRRSVRRHPWRVALVVALPIVVAAVLFIRNAFFDDERELRWLENELRNGRPVELIGEKGKPKWYHRITQNAGSERLGRDGYFGFHAPPNETCIWQLLKDPQMERFRFKAKVRHERSQNRGYVGLFIAYEHHQLKEGNAYFFVELHFNDISDDTAHVRDNPKFPKGQLGNRVFLCPRLYIDFEKLWEPNIYGRQSAPFDPGRKTRPVWRDLCLEVDSERIQGFWGDESIGPMLRSEIGLRVDAALEPARSGLKERMPFLTNFHPVFAPRRPLGFVVRDGSASVAYATVEPLGDR
ncbi:MAG: hypothetical protein L0Y70_05090, partial [Gemmataceae bacterium]|nr:hypothetical protein [Gemmataceae bacterium]